MKKITGYIILGAVTAVIVAIMCSALTISDVKSQNMNCTGIRIVITDSLESRFVSRAEILEYLERGFGNCTGKILNEIDLKKIEDLIDSKSAVRKSEAYVTKDGFLNIEVAQRKPLVRFQGRTCGFYSDAEGYLFPLKSNYASYVIAVDGDIPLKVNADYKGRGRDAEEEKWISQMIELVDFMKKSDIWAENIVQINVRPNGDLVLVPREGREIFLFGKSENIKKKFDMMASYYRSIVPLKGEDYYSSVNVKFGNQIICKK